MQKFFSTTEAAALAGITHRQITYWHVTGFVEPAHVVGTGHGLRRGYSFRDLIALRVTARLRLAEIPLQRIRRVVDYLKTMKGLDSSAEALACTALIVRGADVLAVEDQVHTSLLEAPGQTEISFSVPIAKIVQEMRERVASAA